MLAESIPRIGILTHCQGGQIELFHRVSSLSKPACSA